MSQHAVTVPTVVTPGSQVEDEDKTNVKETIESILVAFILAFIFRAFVVEAFVIPTGSMAPTLLGAHMRYVCPDCGYTFDVNYQSRSEEEDEENGKASSGSDDDVDERSHASPASDGRRSGDDNDADSTGSALADVCV